MKQENCCEYKVSLSYTVKLSQNRQKSRSRWLLAVRQWRQKDGEVLIVFICLLLLPVKRIQLVEDKTGRSSQQASSKSSKNQDSPLPHHT